MINVKLNQHSDKQAIVPWVVLYIVHRKFLGSQEILVNIFINVLDF